MKYSWFTLQNLKALLYQKESPLFLPLGAAWELTFESQRTVNLSHSWNNQRNEFYYVKSKLQLQSFY